MTVPRVGIIGLGSIGHHHADRLPDAALVAGLDHDPDTADAFADEYDVYTTTDRAPFFDRVDAVIICVPNAFHEEFATAALERGIHVLVEKPLAHTVASAERIADAARDADAVCVVGFNNRFARATEEAIARIDRGELGEVRHVEANYVRDGQCPRGWFGDPEVSGGGAMLDLGVHALDLALYLLGHPALEDAMGVTHTHDAADVEHAGHAFVTTQSGQSVAVNAAWRAPLPEYGVTVHGSDGVEEFALLEGATDTHAAEQQAWFDAIEAGAGGNVEEALRVQRALASVYDDAPVEQQTAAPTGVSAGE